VGRARRPGQLGHLGHMNRERGFSILEIIWDLTKDLENDWRRVSGPKDMGIFPKLSGLF
jgi:hypothetical protein